MPRAPVGVDHAPGIAILPPGYKSVEYDEMQRRNEGMRQDLRKSIGICSGGSGAFACKGGDG